MTTAGNHGGNTEAGERPGQIAPGPDLTVDRRELVCALSDTLDLVGIDEVHHGKRVAFMAWTCAGALGFDQDQLDTVYSAALLHDCGVSSTEVHRSLVSELDWDGAQAHCIKGEALLENTRLFSGLARIVRYHHTRWVDLPEDLDEKTARISNLIYLADRVDALLHQHGKTDILIARHTVMKTISRYRGIFFNQELVDAFAAVSDSELFWLSLEPRPLARFLDKMQASGRPMTADRQTLFETAALFAEIVDTKSAFTLEHSRGVARLARYLGSLSGFPEQTLDRLEIAGLLHDLGKLSVPDPILEKPGPLNDAERAVMLRHSFESFQILSRVSGFEEIAHWAAFHHEDLSGRGYPFRKEGSELSIEARIITAADIFQALAQDRPYRSALKTDQIMAIMTDMASSGKLDPDFVSLIDANLTACHQHATGAMTS